MKKILILSLLLNILLGQTPQPWGGISVSNADDLDALTINPAGLAIDRAGQMGLSLSNLRNSAADYYFGAASRMGALGASLFSNANGDYHYSFGLGTQVVQNKVLLGMQYFTDKTLRTGLIVRPFNLLSMGVTSDYYFADKEAAHRIGFGFRPWTNHITIGSDFRFTPQNDSYEYHSPDLFIEAQPLAGLFLRSGYNLDKQDLSLAVGLNLDGFETVFSGNSEYDQHNNFSIMHYQQTRSSFLDIFGKNKKQYVEMKLEGQFIEEPEKKKKPFKIALDLPFTNDQTNYIQLRKWIASVDKLAENEKVAGLIINLSNIRGGFAQILEARNALIKFQNAGKKIIVYTKNLSNINYYFISMADEIYMPNLSGVDLSGLTFEVQFYKELADSLDIVYEVEKISPYKTFADQYTCSTMSDAMRENYGKLFTDCFDEFVAGIAQSRGWSVEETQHKIDAGPYLSKEAVKAGLVTDTMYPSDFAKYKNKLAKSGVEIVQYHKLIKQTPYRYAWRPDQESSKIAVIYAVGKIRNGKSQRRKRGPSSVMGDETIARAIQQARQDKAVEAIVLRVNSGGGSSLASDLIWQEVYKTTTADSAHRKPLIVSMSDVAASGGYYIACQADTIVASPITITGSIGVLAGRWNFSQLLEKVGIHTERLTWGENADMSSNFKLWTPEERKMIRERIIKTYGTFLSRVAQGRAGLDSLAVDSVGLGQIWSGKQARQHKLVDEMGGLTKAVDIAAQAAHIATNKRVEIVEYPQIKKDLSIKNFTKKINSNIYTIELSGTLQELQKQLQRLPNYEDEQCQMIMPVNIIIK